MLELVSSLAKVYARHDTQSPARSCAYLIAPLCRELSPHVSHTRQNLPCQPSEIITKYSTMIWNGIANYLRDSYDPCTDCCSVCTARKWYQRKVVQTARHRNKNAKFGLVTAAVNMLGSMQPDFILQRHNIHYMAPKHGRLCRL